MKWNLKMMTKINLGSAAFNYVTSAMFATGMVIGLGVGAYLLLMVG